jgi:hypothetical protein
MTKHIAVGHGLHGLARIQITYYQDSIIYFEKNGYIFQKTQKNIHRIRIIFLIFSVIFFRRKEVVDVVYKQFAKVYQSITNLFKFK